MNGFSLILAHLLGDYILQNDWMAKNKANPHPGPFPDLRFDKDEPVADSYSKYDAAVYEWHRTRDAHAQGTLACAVHCTFYTLAVWALTWWWMPWWGLLACWVLHYPLDRYRLAGWWMRNVSGQQAFAEGPLSPWSIIVVDNTAHLLVLYGIALLAGCP